MYTLLQYIFIWREVINPLSVHLPLKGRRRRGRNNYVDCLQPMRVFLTLFSLHSSLLSICLMCHRVFLGLHPSHCSQWVCLDESIYRYSVRCQLSQKRLRLRQPPTRPLSPWFVMISIHSNNPPERFELRCFFSLSLSSSDFTWVDSFCPMNSVRSMNN